ncbi:hypothetical protein LSTR_LSTR005783 [Laodelphax striatellus]|uniref:Uncharacterized protein n=1 Tax=Laodelphax striatellus TaxID=195883 RepID=A0A482X041_LAOST|nr:hypothetical protein LSTR_LSTR005783 [Laodelphax striatellus]
MVEFSDLISEFAQFSAQINGLVSVDESTSIEVDENLQVCSKKLALLSEQLEFITRQLEERDKEIMMLKCKLQETTMARDSLANLIKIENKLSRNQQNELENIAEINSELEEENRNLISKINEKQSLLKHLQDCEIDIDKQLKMKEELINLNHNKDTHLDLAEKYDKMKEECQSHLKIIDSLKLNVTSLEGLSDIVKNLEMKNNSLFIECEKKGLLNNELKYQVEEKTKLVVKLTEKLERSIERCRQLEEDLKNILSENKNLRYINNSFTQQKGDYNRQTETIEMTSNLQSSEKCQTNETDIEKGQLLINEKNTLLAQLQEADKNLRKYQHELEISRDQIRKLASLLTENKRHYKEELTKLSMNCEKLAFENLNKDIQIEFLRSTNQTPKNRGRPNAEDQTNVKMSVHCPKIRVQSRDGSLKSSDSNSSIRSDTDFNKELNRNKPNEMSKNAQVINEDETKLSIKKENDKSCQEIEEKGEEEIAKVEKKELNNEQRIIRDEIKDLNKDKRRIIKDEMEEITIIIEKETKSVSKLGTIGTNKEKMEEIKKEESEKIVINDQEISNKETNKELQIDGERKTMKTVGVMTDCDEKVGKSFGAEELLRNLISRLPLTKERGKIGSFDKRFKSIDDLRRLQGKAGQMTEQNVRDILIEVKKFYAITIADMQKNFKAEFDKLSVGHEVALSKLKMQHLDKISQLKREHKERVDKILAAHEDEIKKINTQQQAIQSGNRSSKGLRKK